MPHLSSRDFSGTHNDVPAFNCSLQGLVLASLLYLSSHFSHYFLLLCRNPFYNDSNYSFFFLFCNNCFTFLNMHKATKRTNSISRCIFHFQYIRGYRYHSGGRHGVCRHRMRGGSRHRGKGARGRSTTLPNKSKNNARKN